LWIHVLAGALLIGIGGTVVLGSLALRDSGTEQREFMLRSIPLLNRLGIGCACLIPITGVVNLTFAARAHGFVLSREFLAVVALKLMLFTAMAWALVIVVGRAGVKRVAEREAPILPDLVPWYGFIVTLGTTALALGLWLAGLGG
jgi:hypothetical protein